MEEQRQTSSRLNCLCRRRWCARSSKLTDRACALPSSSPMSCCCSLTAAAIKVFMETQHECVLVMSENGFTSWWMPGSRSLWNLAGVSKQRVSPHSIAYYECGTAGARAYCPKSCRQMRGSNICADPEQESRFRKNPLGPRKHDLRSLDAHHQRHRMITQVSKVSHGRPRLIDALLQQRIVGGDLRIAERLATDGELVYFDAGHEFYRPRRCRLPAST